MKRTIILILLLIIIVFTIGCDKTDENLFDDNNTLEEVNDMGKSDSNYKDNDVISNKKVSPESQIQQSYLISSDIISLSPSKITIKYTNDMENMLTFGKQNTLQILNSDEWITVALMPNVGWDDLLVELKQNESYEETVYLEIYYGELEKGFYRLVKEMFDGEKKIEVVAKFEL